MLSKAKYGPWAVILGGSEGIGAHLALLLGRAGISSVLIARKPGPLEETATRVTSETGVEVRVLSLDISADDAFEQIRALTDDIEVGFLVHNIAGGQNFGSFLESPLEPALDMVQANAIMALKLVHHFGKPMADRGAGGILFFGSLGGVSGSYFLTAYSASKAFNQIFSEGLWAELQPKGVDVLSFLVGLTDTPSYRRSGAVDRNNAHVADPKVVAEQAIEQLVAGGGPVGVSPENAEYFRSLLSKDRRELVELKRSFMSRNHPDAK